MNSKMKISLRFIKHLADIAKKNKTWQHVNKWFYFCWVSNNIITNISNPKQQSHTETQNLRGKHFLFEEKNHGKKSK